LGCTDVWASASDLTDYWELNLTHVCFFNARLLAAFKHLHSTRLVLANVSSGLATRALAGSGLYCTGKAAREMHFRVIAEENKQTNRVRVVNYSPGAMDTEMQDEIRESTATPEATRAMFMGYKKNVRGDPYYSKGTSDSPPFLCIQGQLVRAEDSALYCSQVIVEDTYESGSTVSYDRSKLVAREGLFE
jgi:NAD(P)-dependent dehydrogenase (short-subunit alcohol dehydrogenase family)